jgi:hypothetical protein
MDLQGSQESDYVGIEWHGRPRVVVAPPVNDFDKTQIWMLTERQLRYWTGELGVTAYEIRDAVAATGSRCATTLRQYLSRTRIGSSA